MEPSGEAGSGHLVAAHRPVGEGNERLELFRRADADEDVTRFDGVLR